MSDHFQELIEKAYAAFNARDIDAALATFHPAVQWPKAFEGGYVSGYEEVRDYWTRQWTEINPRVEPVGFQQRPDGTTAVTVHQVVRDLSGELLFDGMVRHVYLVEAGLLRKMDIELD